MPTPDEIARAAARRTTVLSLIRRRISNDGYPPSVSELASATDVTKATTRRDLESLARSGAIEVDPGVARGIRLTEPADA